MKILFMAITLLMSIPAFSAIYGMNVKENELIKYDDLVFPYTNYCSGTIKSIIFKKSNDLIYLKQKYKLNTLGSVILKYEDKANSNCNGLIFTDESIKIGESLIDAIGSEVYLTCIESVVLNKSKVSEICEFEIKK